MPAPDQTSAVDAVRALLGALGAPALAQALGLETVLAGRLQDLGRAPNATGFDPLARPPAGTAPAGSRTSERARSSESAAARRRAAASAATSPAAKPDIGVLIGDALATTPAVPAGPVAGALAGIAAALVGLAGPATGKAPGGAPKSIPGAVRPAQGIARAAGLAVTGAVSRTMGAGAQQLAALPATAGAAPVLETIAKLSRMLWWRSVLTSPPGGVEPVMPWVTRPARRPASIAGARPGAAPNSPAPAIGGGAVASSADQALSALADIGRLSVDLFAYAAHAGSPASSAPSAHPASRAPSVLAPPPGERGPAPAMGSTEPGAAPARSAAVLASVVPMAGVTADDLARALRAEGLLRGVDLP